MRQQQLQKVHCVNCGHLFRDHFQPLSGNKVGGCEMVSPRTGYKASWECACRTFEFPPAKHSPEVEISKDELLGPIPRPECANCGHDYGLHVEITPFEGMRDIGCQHLDIGLEFQGKGCPCGGYEPMTETEPIDRTRCPATHPETGLQCSKDAEHDGRHRRLGDGIYWGEENNPPSSSSFPNFEERARHTIEKVIQSLLDLLSNIKGSSEKIG